MKFHMMNLLKELYSSYYLENDLDVNKDCSSHWAYHSDQFFVKLDERNSVLSLKGVGFGDMMTRNPGQKCLNWILHIIHILKHKDKKNVIRLLDEARLICKLSSFSISFDVFKQILSLNLIMNHMSQNMINKSRLVFVVIGDGYGFMSCLIKKCFPSSTVILIDLGKTLLFQAYYCQKVHRQYVHASVNNINLTNNLNEVDFIYCPADKVSLLSQRFPIDVAINIASMQEMKPESIKGYFNFLRMNLVSENLFYCCNREKKTLLGGEVLEFEKYPYVESDHHYVNEYCSWYKFFLYIRPFSKNNVRFLGIKIPFIRYFDGPIMHRLSRLSIGSVESEEK